MKIKVDDRVVEAVHVDGGRGQDGRAAVDVRVRGARIVIGDVREAAAIGVLGNSFQHSGGCRDFFGHERSQ